MVRRIQLAAALIGADVIFVVGGPTDSSFSMKQQEPTATFSISFRNLHPGHQLCAAINLFRVPANMDPCCGLQSRLWLPETLFIEPPRAFFGGVCT